MVPYYDRIRKNKERTRSITTVYGLRIRRPRHINKCALFYSLFYFNYFPFLWYQMWLFYPLMFIVHPINQRFEYVFVLVLLYLKHFFSLDSLPVLANVGWFSHETSNIII
jgi:hypothetical protein